MYVDIVIFVNMRIFMTVEIAIKMTTYTQMLSLHLGLLL